MAKSKSVTVAAETSGSIIQRFRAVEQAAREARQETETNAVMRALFQTDGQHFVRLERGATTIEIENGAVAISVREGEDQ